MIIIMGVTLLIGLLYCEKSENRRGMLPVKTLLSLLFIFTAIIQPHPLSRYYHFLLVGLVFCLGGDVFLAFPQKKMFLFGLSSFLMGHVFYIFAFFFVAQVNRLTGAGSLSVLVIGIWVYVWLKPYLGTMKAPVIVYIIVISIMVSGAWSVLGNPDVSRQGRIMVFFGAMSFYFSDVFVARDRFISKEFLNRVIGLPLYYTGQFLLAFSVGLLR
jgi:uncharacterized membrane protein YhhN